MKMDINNVTFQLLLPIFLLLVTFFTYDFLALEEELTVSLRIAEHYSPSAG
jgi:hypothetical protein